MRGVNGLVSGTFFLLAAIVLCHLQGAQPTVALVLVPVAFLCGVLASRALPDDADRQDQLGFVATVTLLFAILLWAIEGLFVPLLGFLGPEIAVALAPLVPALALHRLARWLLDFELRDWNIRVRPLPGVRVLDVGLALVGVVAVGALEGRLGDLPSAGTAAMIAISLAFEELFYRGFLLAAFRERIGTRAAVPLQAIVYTAAGALGELSVVGVSVRLAVGLVAGGAAASTGWVNAVWVARLVGVVLGWAVWSG